MEVKIGVKERKDSNEREGGYFVVLEEVHCWKGGGQERGIYKYVEFFFLHFVVIFNPQKLSTLITINGTNERVTRRFDT